MFQALRMLVPFTKLPRQRMLFSALVSAIAEPGLFTRSQFADPSGLPVRKHIFATVLLLGFSIIASLPPF